MNSDSVGCLRNSANACLQVPYRRYVEVNSKNSTKTCADCGTLHDRDVNAARNTLIAGAGTALESEAA